MVAHWQFLKLFFDVFDQALVQVIHTCHTLQVLCFTCSFWKIVPGRSKIVFCNFRVDGVQSKILPVLFTCNAGFLAIFRWVKSLSKKFPLIFWAKFQSCFLFLGKIPKICLIWPVKYSRKMAFFWLWQKSFQLEWSDSNKWKAILVFVSPDKVRPPKIHWPRIIIQIRRKTGRHPCFFSYLLTESFTKGQLEPIFLSCETAHLPL